MGLQISYLNIKYDDTKGFEVLDVNAIEFVNICRVMELRRYLGISYLRKQVVLRRKSKARELLNHDRVIIYKLFKLDYI